MKETPPSLRHMMFLSLRCTSSTSSTMSSANKTSIIQKKDNKTSNSYNI